MFVTYSPETGDRQSWEFDPRKVRASKAEMIERRAGESWDRWLVAVQTGSMRARRVLLWHLLTLAHPGLRFEDVPDFLAGELTVEHSATELGEIRERLTRMTLPEEQRRAALDILDVQIADAEARQGTAEGKALSPNADSGTPGR